jgi:acetyltransferase-like isoleucine patch superfamily enzyme
LEFGFMIQTGAGLILEDDVKINALSAHGISFGNNVTIGRGAILVCTGVVANKGEGILIGSNSAVGALSFLGGQGGIRIGNNVIMGPSVRIFSENHNFEDPAVPIRKQGESRQGVVIEDDCWIGAGATILDGATIGTGSVVAAASVVTRSVPPFSVVAGVPAKVIKSRVQPSFS